MGTCPGAGLRTHVLNANRLSGWSFSEAKDAFVFTLLKQFVGCVPDSVF